METAHVEKDVIFHSQTGPEARVLANLLRAVNETNRLLAEIGTILEQNRTPQYVVNQHKSK